MNAKKPLMAWACASLLCASAALGQIYKTTDENGNVVFTDQPPSGSRAAEEVKLKQLNTTPAPTPLPARETPAEEPAGPDYTVSIKFPTNETTIPMGPGNFSVVASTFPPLRAGEVLQLQINGTDRGPAQTGSNWELTNVFRGAHELTVQRKSAEGEVLTTSEAVTVYVHRPSIKFQNN